MQLHHIAKLSQKMLFTRMQLHHTSTARKWLIDVIILLVIQGFFKFFSLQVMLHNGAHNCKVVSNMLINAVIDLLTGVCWMSSKLIKFFSRSNKNWTFLNLLISHLQICFFFLFLIFRIFVIKNMGK